MLGPQKLPKIDQDAKKKVPRQFFDSQEAKNDDSGPPPRRRPRTGSPKGLILYDFWTFFDHFLKDICILLICLRSTQKVHKKQLLPPWVLHFGLSGKNRKMFLKQWFSSEKPFKNRGGKKATKNIDFRGFSRVQKGWKPTILKWKSPPQLRTAHFWGF